MTQLLVKLIHAGSGNPVWLGVGFPAIAGSMVGATAVIGSETDGVLM